LVSLALDRECDAPSSPNSLKYSSLSQNQVLLIMPHGQLATAVESQIECTVVVLLAAVVSMKYLRVCDVRGSQGPDPVEVDSNFRCKALTQVCSSHSSARISQLVIRVPRGKI